MLVHAYEYANVHAGRRWRRRRSLPDPGIVRRVELLPLVARNVRRIGPLAAAAIAARVCWSVPWLAIRRLLTPSTQPPADRIHARAPWPSARPGAGA